jgi:1-phosphofructokinase family hexose kinase
VIITVTPNAALDVTYEVDELRPQHSHRVRAMHQRAGGKGVNVASVLALMGHEVVATGFAGGATGVQIRADLDVRGLRHRLVECDSESRRTINVVSAMNGEATIFNEPGPQVPAPRWRELLDNLCELLDSTADPVVVLSGSLPRGLATDAYAEMITLCRGRGARTIVDTSRAPFLSAVSAGPDLVKPNTAELVEAVATLDPILGAAELRRRGARTVVVSAGGDGLMLLPSQRRGWRGRLAEPLRGNPTGAGDAAVGALAAGLATGATAHDMVQAAVAWSAAAVLQPVAGQVDPADIDRLYGQVLLEEYP